MRASRTFPPLQSLRAFEAVGRLRSFRRAGEELLIAQSAVSHHVRQVEDMLGQRLILRQPRGIALSEAGERFLGQLQQAFDLLATATAEITGAAAPKAIRVSVLPSFAANWLVPRLARFTAAHPQVAVMLDPTLRLVDVAAGECDLAIRYGGGGWSGTEERLLMTERLTPVLSPALLQRGPPLESITDLAAHTLLLTMRPYDWAQWSEAAGFDFSSARTLQLTDYNIVLQAALDGTGVALGRRRLIEARLRDGDLVAPFELEVSVPRFGYWLLGTEQRLRDRSVDAFVQWIVAECADVDADP